MPLGSTTVCLAHRMSTRGLFSTRKVSLPTKPTAAGSCPSPLLLPQPPPLPDRNCTAGMRDRPSVLKAFHLWHGSHDSKQKEAKMELCRVERFV